MLCSAWRMLSLFCVSKTAIEKDLFPVYSISCIDDFPFICKGGSRNIIHVQSKSMEKKLLRLFLCNSLN